MVIYVDGSCKGNPGPGGFGVVVLNDKGDIINQYQEFCENTTNNREEMKAIIWALENYGKCVPSIIVYSDSAYCVNTFNIWMKNWKVNGWKRPKGQQVENLDLVKKYDKLINEGYLIDLQKVKGHADNEFNNLADKLATGYLLL